MTTQQLSIADEIVLLMLDDSTGSFIRMRDFTMRYSLSGALLMDLALRNRIDSDLESLTIIDKTPTGDSLLDGLLRNIGQESGARSIRFWVERTAVHADAVRGVCLERLVNLGILEQRDEKYLWVFKTRRYPVIDGQAEKEVKKRLFELLYSDTIPDPRDAILLCLAQASGILNELMPANELQSAQERIDQVKQLDLIGQTMSSAIWDIEVSLAVASQPQFY